MPNDVNDTPPENGAGDDAYRALAAKKGIPLDEKLSPSAEAYLKQLRETTAHATTPEASGLEVARTQALTPDFDPTAPPSKLETGGPPPTVPPKDPPSGGGGGGEDASRNDPLWLVILKDLFKDKHFVMGFVGLLFLIVGYTAYYWINKFNNSPESLAAQKQNILLLKEMEEVREKNTSRSLFSSSPATTETVGNDCTITASTRQSNQRYQENGNCLRVKYENIPNDPGLYIPFEHRRPISVEGKYRLLDGKKLLCQTEDSSEENFSTDGCTSAFTNKSLTSVGFAPLKYGSIIVSYPSR